MAIFSQPRLAAVPASIAVFCLGFRLRSWRQIQLPGRMIPLPNVSGKCEIRPTARAQIEIDDRGRDWARSFDVKEKCTCNRQSRHSLRHGAETPRLLLLSAPVSFLTVSPLQRLRRQNLNVSTPRVSVGVF